MKFLVLLFCAACSLASTQGDDNRDFQNGKANEMVWKPNSNSRTFDGVNGIETLAIPSEGGVAGGIELKRMANMEDRRGPRRRPKPSCRNRGCGSSCSSGTCCRDNARRKCLCDKDPGEYVFCPNFKYGK